MSWNLKLKLGVGRTLLGVSLFFCGTSAYAQNAGVLIGLRSGRGDGEGQFGPQSYRTIWIRQQGDEISIVELPWLLVTSPSGYLRLAVTTTQRGERQSEEEISLVPVPGPTPPAVRRLDLDGPDCPATTSRTLQSVERDALVVKVYLEEACGGGQTVDDESTDILPKLDVSQPRSRFDILFDALASPPMPTDARRLSKEPLWPAIQRSVRGAQGAVDQPTAQPGCHTRAGHSCGSNYP